MEPLILATGVAAAFAAGVAACQHRRVRRAEARIADLTRKLAQERYAANHDPLTGLFNRRAFYDLGARLLADAGRPGLVAVLVDLDGFKAVNDSLGHAAGDKVLVEIARRFSRYADEDLVARLGGDEFAGLLTTASHRPTRLRSAVGGLTALLSAPVEVSGRQVSIAVSVGLAPVDDGARLPEVLGHADAAMYRAKGSGRGTAYFDPVLDDDTPPRPGVRPAVRTRDLVPMAAPMSQQTRLPCA